MAQGQGKLVVMPVRPWSWLELLWTFLFGLGIGVVLTVVFAAGYAHAGGSAVVRWDQPADCTSVTGWEFLGAPITAAQPDPQPTVATLQVSIANVAPVVCGFGASKTVTVAGVGPQRYWLRAVMGAVKSGESNSVDVTLPLARPSGLTVAVP